MGDSIRPPPGAEFDQYAEAYDEMHTASVSASGEGPEYFAAYKLRCIERLVGPNFRRPLLDFACGIGNLTRLLVRSFREVHGYDLSTECLGFARRRAPQARFFSDPSALPRSHYGALILSNVLHHVPPAERDALMKTAVDCLAPGGMVVVFEHNPFNPLTRRAVAACAFDDNALLLYPWENTRLLRRAGLRDVKRDFIVFFPHALSAMRPLEPLLAWLPMGAQVCAWGVKA